MVGLCQYLAQGVSAWLPGLHYTHLIFIVL